MPPELSRKASPFLIKAVAGTCLLIAALVGQRALAHHSCGRDADGAIIGAWHAVKDADSDSRIDEAYWGCGDAPSLSFPWRETYFNPDGYEYDCNPNDYNNSRLTEMWPDIDGDYSVDSTSSSIFCGNVHDGWSDVGPVEVEFQGIRYFATDCDPNNPAITTNGWLDTDGDGYTDYINDDSYSCHENKIMGLGYLSKRL